MNRNDEIKSIMKKLRDSNNESSVKNEKLINEEDSSTENDTSESDVILARLEDIVSRFEKALSIVDNEGEEEEAPAEGEEEVEVEETEETEAPAEGEEENTEEEEAAEESYERTLEDRLAALERRFTESRRRTLCRRFNR